MTTLTCLLVFSLMIATTSAFAEVADPSVSRLTDRGTDQESAWSPDGRRIAFSRLDEVAPKQYVHKIYVMNADGSGPRPVTQGVQPCWSPDGKQILFQGHGIYTVDVPEAIREKAAGTQ